MTRFVSGWLSAFCAMEIATGHLWLAVATGIAAAVLLVTARLKEMRDNRTFVTGEDLLMTKWFETISKRRQ